MKQILSLLLLTIATFSYSQDDFNLELLSNVTYPEAGNDIWGWVAPDSTEYAIVGTVDNTRIYELSDSIDPVEIIAIPGQNSIWRDMKSWEDHIYVSCDQRPDGLLVIDMSEIATDSIRYHYYKPPVPTTVNNDTVTLGRCHNIFIDENGYAYMAGCRDVNTNPVGMNKAVIFDLNADKWSPPIVGVHGDGTQPTYAHDLYVRDNIMYSSEIYKGAMVIWDVTDKANIEYLGETQTSFNFTHNIWISDDGKYAYTTDERGNAFVDAYDITDFKNIKRVDKFQPLETVGRNVVPHNTHFMDDFLITSWYTDGIVVTDVTRPDNMIKVAAYDTWPDADGGTEGCWGAYPWLPSGKILANDRKYGLFVLEPQYVRACYLEGIVTDEVDGSQINGVAVEVLNTLNNDMTNSKGEFKTGDANPGTYTVRFQHPQYQTLETDAILVNGELTQLDVQLTRRPIAVRGRIIAESSGIEIQEGKLRVTTPDNQYFVKPKLNGEFVYYADDEQQELIFGAWGYRHKLLDYRPDGEELIVELKDGYQDDFVLDFDWVVDGNDDVGIWVRDVPLQSLSSVQTGSQVVNIGYDVEGDIGESAYITGNGSSVPSEDDVDATNILRSPPMLLENYSNPQINFRAYFYNGGGNGTPPNDNMQIVLSDGTDIVSLTAITGKTIDWTDVIKIDVKPLGLNIANPIRISFTVTDEDPGHWVEAGIDVFRVLDTDNTSTTELANIEKVRIFPNPAENVLNIETEVEDLEKINIYNVDGKKVLSAAFSHKLDVSRLNSGIYLLSLEKKDGKRLTSQLVKK